MKRNPESKTKNTSLSLSRPSELQSAISSMCMYLSTSATRIPLQRRIPATVAKSVSSIASKYSISTARSHLGNPFDPAKVDLYTYANKPGTQKILSSMRHPTPHGWQSMTETGYTQFWSRVDLEQRVFLPDRNKRKSCSEREEMCFVYIIVVVELRERGFLDRHNRPMFRYETKRNCPLTGAVPSGISIKNTVFQSSSPA
jgi:hypothetical protein